MGFVKKLVEKKYFWVIFFFLLIVFFSFMLHLAISNDEKASQPLDDMIRAEAKVINFPDSYSIIQDGKAQELYTGIQISIQLSEKEKYEGLLEGTVSKDKVDKLEYGSMLKVKYSEKNHSLFFFADDPPVRRRVFLYIVLSILIAMSIGATIFSSKVLQVLSHRKVMKENKEEILRQKAQAEEDASRYDGMFGNEKGTDYTPFNDKGIDYNALYEQNKQLDDAAYNSDDTYTGYGDVSFSAADPAPTSAYGTPSFGAADPAPTSAHGTPSFGAADPAPTPTYGTPSFGAADPAPTSSYGTPSFGAAETTTADMNSYGMPNASMDAPYDPNAPYTGYGMPNVSMDTAYDPNAPYTGY